MGTYYIVLADDHALFRQGLKGIIEGTADFKVVGEAADGLELLNLLNELTPHMVILDISMPKLRGIEAIREIKALHPNVKVLIVTMHKDKEYLSQALSQGVDGYFLKKDADTELFSAIEKVRKGKVYISPHLSEELGDNWAELLQGRKFILTAREREVLKLISDGKSNKEIANLLFISIRTVERHRANILMKLNVRKTADLVKYAIEKGYA